MRALEEFELENVAGGLSSRTGALRGTPLWDREALRSNALGPLISKVMGYDSVQRAFGQASEDGQISQTNLFEKDVTIMNVDHYDPEVIGTEVVDLTVDEAWLVLEAGEPPLLVKTHVDLGIFIPDPTNGAIDDVDPDEPPAQSVTVTEVDPEQLASIAGGTEQLTALAVTSVGDAFLNNLPEGYENTYFGELMSVEENRIALQIAVDELRAIGETGSYLSADVELTTATGVTYTFWLDSNNGSVFNLNNPWDEEGPAMVVQGFLMSGTDNWLQTELQTLTGPAVHSLDQFG